MDEQGVASSETAAEAPPANCVVDQEWVGRVAVVSVTGVIDMLTAPTLQRAVQAALAKKPGGLVIDFTNVEFLASAGMGVLVAVHDSLSPDVRFCIVADGPATSRPLQLVGIADLIKLYASLDEAMSSMSA